MDTTKEKEVLPPFLNKQFYEREGHRCIGTALPAGKQSGATKTILIGMFLIVFISFILFIGMQRSFGLENLLQTYPFLCMLALLLYFSFWNKHLGTILINGQKRIWPKHGVYSFHKGNRIQVILAIIILGMFFVLAPWFFLIIFLINAGLSYAYGISWKQPPAMQLKLSQPHYFAGDTLHFTIESDASPQKRYIQLYNLEMITLKRKRSKKNRHHSKVLYYDWCCLEKGESEVRFSIPTSGFVGTDFSKEEATGWIIRINNEQASIHDEPYLMPIFDR